MAKICGNCKKVIWSLDLINNPGCNCGWNSDAPPPAIKAEDPVEVLVRSSNVTVKGKYIMFSDKKTQPNKIHLEDGCVCFTRGCEEVEMVILPGTGKPVKTVRIPLGGEQMQEVHVSEMFQIKNV